MVPHSHHLEAALAREDLLPQAAAVPHPLVTDQWDLATVVLADLLALTLHPAEPPPALHQALDDPRVVP